MNYIIGALVISMSLSGMPADTAPASPVSPEENIIVFEQTEEEKQAEELKKAQEEAARIAAEEQRVQEEAAKKAEEERKALEEIAKKAEEERIAQEEALKNSDEEELAATDAAKRIAVESALKSGKTDSLNYDYDIASYTTKYSQAAVNANRNYNMLLASDSINGIILNPGDSFSYNNVILSHRTSERDYKDAGVISDGKIVDAIGGGICQISSTLYNAALYSGMTITQRRNHSLKVGYLPAGRDATASWGSIDFCFRNDLSIPVKIESIMKDGVIKIRFLSPVNPNLGNIELKVFQNDGVYTLYRYVDGVADYKANSVYKG